MISNFNSSIKTGEDAFYGQHTYYSSNTGYSIKLYRIGNIRIIMGGNAQTNSGAIPLAALADITLDPEDLPPVQQAVEVMLTNRDDTTDKMTRGSICIHPQNGFNMTAYRNTSYNSSTARSSITSQSSNLTINGTIIYYV